MNLTAKTLAAAWRENLTGIRDRTTAPAWTGHEGPYNQLTIDTAPDLDPADLLAAILGHPAPPHLRAELESARTGHRLARTRAAARGDHLRALAARTGTDTLAELITACDRGPDQTARLLETLNTGGHQLHPCARTRLGWNRHDFERYDLETPAPVRLRLLADPTGTLARSGTDLRDHPMLTGLDLPDPVLPVHPWQLEHRIRPRHGDLLTTGRLRLLDQTVPAWPTAAIRTLCGHHRPGHLKLALGIDITSTRRDISPTTARLAPELTTALADLTGHDPGHTIAADTAGAWLPGSRDLTAIARDSLTAAAPTGTAVVPAAALCATSPITGTSLAAEYAAWSGDPDTWARTYTRLVVPPVLRLAAHGIGLEAHLQNSLIAFDRHRPVRLITRDLGGVRLWRPALPFHLDLPDGAPIDATDPAQVRAKVTYTLFQNHLAAVATALSADTGLDQDAFWAHLADLIDGLDLPTADRDAYLADRVPTKALLTMRLNPGTEIETDVDNPLARARS